MILAADTPVSFGHMLGEQLAPLLSTLVVGILTAGVAAIPAAFQWISAHVKLTKHAAADAVLQRLLGVVEVAVNNASQTAVTAAKSATYSTPEERKIALESIKTAVVSQVMSDLSAQNLVKEAKTVFGITGDAGDLTAKVGELVESAVAKSKA